MDYRWPLFTLFVLALVDIGLTMIGLNLGLIELNPMFEYMGWTIFEFRMATVGIFIGLFGLLSEKFHWAFSRALWLVLAIMALVILWNMIQIGSEVI